jgi:hypothetical protein
MIKGNLPHYPYPSRVDGGRRPQMATFREAGKSFDFYAFIIAIFSDGVKSDTRKTANF